MKIKKFVAEKVYGYLDFNIEFNDDVNFLVGGNGSGKTTALKLMNALIKLNLKDLMLIPFNSCVVTISDIGGEKNIDISVKSSKEDLIFSIGTVEETLKVPIYRIDEMEYSRKNEEKLDEFIEMFLHKNSDNEVYKTIKSLDSPIFLGLDRRSNLDNNDEILQQRFITGYGIVQSRRNIRNAFFKGSIGASLTEIAFLVQNEYRIIRRRDDRQALTLRNKILSSIFSYNNLEIEQKGLVPDVEYFKEKQNLIERKKEIQDTISKLVGDESQVAKQLDEFFYKITQLLQSGESTENFNVIEWLLNKSQIDRITDIVEIIDKHKSQVDTYYKPINDFLALINDFYKESNKTLSIDTVGEMIIKRPNGVECSIEGLSSGERQLLVIFSHTFFNRKNRENIFIIDEPELSLHISWQEKFSDTIFKIDNKAQFILATHSPEIISDRTDKAVGCR